MNNISIRIINNDNNSALRNVLCSYYQTILAMVRRLKSYFSPLVSFIVVFYTNKVYFFS